MGLKQSRIIGLLLIMAFYLQTLSAQYDTDSTVYMADTAADILYDPLYHFDDTAQWHYENIRESEIFDSAHWKKMARELSYEEIIKKEKLPTDAGKLTPR